MAGLCEAGRAAWSFRGHRPRLQQKIRLVTRLLPAGPRTGPSMASWRPTGPTASPVLAFTPTRSTGTPNKLGDPLANLLFVRGKLGLLDKHDAVEIDDLEPSAGDLLPGKLQHFCRIAAAVRFGRCRETSRRYPPAPPRPAGRRSRRAAGRRHRYAPPPARLQGISIPPSRNGPPGASRCVSCPIPMRAPSVARSPDPPWSYPLTRSRDYNGLAMCGQREQCATVADSKLGRARADVAFPRRSAIPIIAALMAIIEIEGLAKSYRVYQKQEGLLATVRGLFHRTYREVEAVRGIDLRVESGEFVAFLGPNGAGKTTTLKLLSGVINPTRGTARVMGHVPWQRENAYRRRFALVMGQKNQLWWDLPAAGIVPPAPADLSHRAGPVRPTPRRAGRPAGRAAAAGPAGARAVAGRADEDGADRRAAALARGAVSRRADDRPGRGGPAQHPDRSCATTSRCGR